MQSIQSKGVIGKVLILLGLNDEGCERLMPLAAFVCIYSLILASWVGWVGQFFQIILGSRGAGIWSFPEGWGLDEDFF
jgi:hypothetical protein